MEDKKPLGCGSCNLCCKLLGVPDIGKPPQMLCWHTGLHGGCAVQDQKATDESLFACAQFRCLFLASQDREPEKRWPRHWRPDMIHVVFGPFDRTDDKLVYVQVDPKFPNAWKEPIASAIIADACERGMKFEIIVDDADHIILTNKGLGEYCARPTS